MQSLLLSGRKRFPSWHAVSCGGSLQELKRAIAAYSLIDSPEIAPPLATPVLSGDRFLPNQWLIVGDRTKGEGGGGAPRER